MAFPLSLLRHPVRDLDFKIIPDILIQEVQNIFPVAATVDFCFVPGKLEDVASDVQGKEQELLRQSCSGGTPIRNRDTLVVPLLVEDDGWVVLIIKMIDPGFLARLSTDWLQEAQGKIKGRLEFIRQIFVDPVSGYYNGRCLVHYLKQIIKSIAAGNEQGYLLFINTDYRSRGVSSGLQKISQTAGFLEAVTACPVFYLGTSVFAFIFYCRSRQDVLTCSGKLLARMKREGFAHVHIGATRIPDQDGSMPVASILEECWQALECSEKRGPFSKYLSDMSRQDAAKLFIPPPSSAMAKLRRSWRGLDNFGLLLIQTEPCKSCSDLAGVIGNAIDDNEVCVPLAGNAAYVLLPQPTDKAAKARATALHGVLVEKYGCKDIAMGFCFWPCLKYSKANTTVNAQKALQHGSFFGPGQLTFFDSVSLNVSGDYYFDEGDYKQAAKDYQQGLELQPDDINLMNSLGVTLAEMNLNRQAIRWFHKVLRKQPDNYMALVNLGFTWRSLRRPEKALANFEKAYSIAIDNGKTVSPELFLQLGRLYCQAGRFQDGLELLLRWDEDGSGKKEFQLYRLLGEALMETGRKKEAIITLQQALRLHPGHAESLSMLGFLYYDTGQGDEIGLSLCRKAVELDENNADNWYRLGSVLFAQDKVDEALGAVRNSVRLRKKNNLQARLFLARIYEYNKKYYLARRIYKSVVLANKPAWRDQFFDSRPQQEPATSQSTGQNAWLCSSKKLVEQIKIAEQGLVRVIRLSGNS